MKLYTPHYNLSVTQSEIRQANGATSWYSYNHIMATSYVDTDASGQQGLAPISKTEYVLL